MKQANHSKWMAAKPLPLLLNPILLAGLKRNSATPMKSDLHIRNIALQEVSK